MEGEEVHRRVGVSDGEGLLGWVWTPGWKVRSFNRGDQGDVIFEMGEVTSITVDI